MMSARNMVAAVCPNTNANARSAEENTNHKLATSTSNIPREMKSATMPNRTVRSLPTLRTKPAVLASVFEHASRCS